MCQSLRAYWRDIWSQSWLLLLIVFSFGVNLKHVHDRFERMFGFGHLVFKTETWMEEEDGGSGAGLFALVFHCCFWLISVPDHCGWSNNYSQGFRNLIMNVAPNVLWKMPLFSEMLQSADTTHLKSIIISSLENKCFWQQTEEGRDLCKLYLLL